MTACGKSTPQTASSEAISTASPAPTAQPSIDTLENKTTKESGQTVVYVGDSGTRIEVYDPCHEIGVCRTPPAPETEEDKRKNAVIEIKPLKVIEPSE